MAFRTKKISQMDPKGSNLASTDLLEISQLVSGSYVTKSITGAEIISGATTGFVPTTRTLTINGTTQDLSADRTFTISTGITIGTTAITSGTVGRVLFEGTGNVVQESANLFWDNTNGRLGIGTSTGTSKINLPDAGTTASDGIAFGNGANIFKNASNGISLFSGSGTWQFNSAILVLPTNQATFIRMASNRNLLIDNGTTTFASINGTTGNVLINTTTDAGFKLDVNGTARITGLAYQTGYSYSIQRLQFNQGVTTTNVGYISGISNGVIRLTNASEADFTRLQFGGGTTAFPSLQRSGSALAIMDATGTALSNLLIGTTTDAGYKLDVNGTARFTGNIFLPTDILIGSGQSTSVWNRIMLYDVTNGSINITMHNPAWYIRHNANMSMDGAMQVGSNTSAVASAVLQATSTTKGFLPPRMTTTQKNAIASPATGLMVYDTTLNVITYYNGTTWI